MSVFFMKITLLYIVAVHSLCQAAPTERDMDGSGYDTFTDGLGMQPGNSVVPSFQCSAVNRLDEAMVSETVLLLNEGLTLAISYTQTVSQSFKGTCSYK